MPSEKDVVEEAREHAAERPVCGVCGRLLNSLADEVSYARRALKDVVELWDVNNPDDRCGCVGASDDCKYPPPCELCVARLIMDGRTRELFED